MSKYKPYIISGILTLLVGALGGIVTYRGMGDFMALEQPPLSPPGWFFPVVWTILYLLMAFGAARVYVKGGRVISGELILYGVQLVFNFLWCVFFFGLGAYLFSFIWLLALLGLVTAMIIAFYGRDKLAGLLQIPYILWLCFAGYLNLFIYILNQAA